MTYAITIRIAPAALLLTASFAQVELPELASSAERSRALVERTWASCAVCHAAPDARIEHDARWIGLNQTTACLTGEAATPENRKELIGFLKDGLAPRPTLFQAGVTVDKSAGENAPDPAHGFVQVPSTAGSAFLRSTSDTNARTVRLVWGATKEGDRVALPPGDYALVGYCFYASGSSRSGSSRSGSSRSGSFLPESPPGGSTSGDDAQWTASATVQEGQAPDVIKVRAGKAASLPVVPSMYHDLSAIADGPELAISFQMRNEAGDRMTLTRDGALVEPTWVASNDDGVQVASGRFVPT